MYRAGIDIGGTKINIGLIDESYKLIAVKKLIVAEINNTAVEIKNTLSLLCSQNNIDFSEICSLGIGIPGTVSDDGKKILKAPNISILHDNFACDIAKELNIPVTLVQDSRSAAYGEYICGGGKGKSNVVCITLGTGIGTGIVINGKIFNGALGCAGEIGHLCVHENGRHCGCGKNGCLEKYCAGGGLDITAKELLGEDKTANDLFEAAKSGNTCAADKISEAVTMLGNAIVGIVNLLSPDCILFSGGLSEQNTLYLEPLIEYIKSHCYNCGILPEIKKAELGEYSPLIGAACVPVTIKKPPVISASIMCADPLNYAKALDDLKSAGIQYIHCDIMDNHFVPNLMLPMELFNKLKKYTDIPFDYHIMAENPKSIIDKLDVSENDIISVHVESTPHLNQALNAVKSKGAKAAVAINPATPLDSISEVLCDIDMVLLMTVNPGFAGQKIVSSAFDKIKRLRSFLDDKGYSNIPIEVDGNCSFENVPMMYNAGAEIFVAGTSSIFSKTMSIKEATEKLLNTMNF